MGCLIIKEKRWGYMIRNKLRKLLCFLGFHKIQTIENYITISKCKCIYCNMKFINSLFGLFKDEI